MADAKTTAQNTPADKDYIREVQQYLRTIAQHNDRVPMIAVDGFYDNKTADAVRAFQTISGLPVTGEVDNDTFNALLGAYTAVRGLGADTQRIKGFPDTERVLSEGEESFEVYFIQIMLNELAKLFANIELIRLTGRLDQPTVRAISEICKATEIGGAALDRATWDAITELFNNTVGRS